MTSIGAIGPSAPPVPQNYGLPARAPDRRPTPAENTIDRVDKLTRQLDASLTGKIDGIRARISSGGGGSHEPSAPPRRLDVQA